MNNDNFLVNSDSLCKIIKECAKSNVREFKFGALSLAFGVKDHPTKTLDSVETKPDEQAISKINDEVLAQQKRDLLRDELENLRLTDPLAYEQVIGGELDVGAPS